MSKVSSRSLSPSVGRLTFMYYHLPVSPWILYYFLILSYIATVLFCSLFELSFKRFLTLEGVFILLITCTMTTSFSSSTTREVISSLVIAHYQFSFLFFFFSLIFFSFLTFFSFIFIFIFILILRQSNITMSYAGIYF